VQAFGKNYMAVGFKIDYVKADGELSTYTPDFIVRTTDGKCLDRRDQGPRGAGPAAENGAPQAVVRGRHRPRVKDDGGPRYGFVYVDQESFEAAQAVVVRGAGEHLPRISRELTMAAQDKKSYDLSEAEQRDLVTLIQQGKALPEKYRFILFEDKREVELVWNGKTRDVCTTVLPFQTLEHIDEPRAETKTQEDLFDSRGRQQAGWTNKLIWGDNKLILSSLKAGALRQQIEDAGRLKLIYIDPPFDVGADFSMDIEIGGETFHKEPNLLEQIAYRDTWGTRRRFFIAMIYERLILMRDLLAEDGHGMGRIALCTRNSG
jgi:hypothetical protein